MLKIHKPKCLIIHGFGGGLYEVEPLASYLASLGYEVVCPVLKGHGLSRKEMSKAKYKEWIASAEQELIKLRESGDEIILIGFSMGGLIAFNLACTYKIQAIVTINTPIFFWNIYQVFRNLTADIANKNLNHCQRYLRARNNSPFLSMVQFLRLLHKTKPRLKEIDCPLFIIQAKDDDTVRRKSVDYMNGHVSSAHKRIKYFPEGGHLILLSPTAKQVMTAVEDFIKTIFSEG